MEPVVRSSSLDDLLPDFDTGYVWVGKKTEEPVLQEQYENAGPNKDRVFSTIYPPIPTEALAGTRYGEQTAYCKAQSGSFWRRLVFPYTRIIAWLECVPVTSAEAAGSGYHFGGRR
jgi:hypothetical protein